MELSWEFVHTGKAPELKASLEALKTVMESEYAKAQEQLFEILK